MYRRTRVCYVQVSVWLKGAGSIYSYKDRLLFIKLLCACTRGKAFGFCLSIVVAKIARSPHLGAYRSMLNADQMQHMGYVL